MQTPLLAFGAVLFLALSSGLSLGSQLGAGAAAPTWQLQSLDGHSVQLSDFKGKVVILDFWAPWSSGSRSEIAHLADLQKQDAAKGLVVVGLVVDHGGPGAATLFLKSHRAITYPVVMSNDIVNVQYGGIVALPTTFVLDRDGMIADIHEGPVGLGILEKDLKKLL